MFYEQTERQTKTGKTVQHKAADYDSVISGVVELLDAARRASARAVNSLMTATYWEIGRRIVEHEQAGENARLTARSFSRAFPVTSRNVLAGDTAWTTLNDARKFYLTLPSPENPQRRCGFPRPPDLAPISATALRKSPGDEVIEWMRVTLLRNFPCRGRITPGCCGCGTRMPSNFTTPKPCAAAGR
jgi:hypothetical protein